MNSIIPYLTFDGNCEEAFNFYKGIFGGEFNFMGRFSDMPSEEPLPEDEQNRVMHVSLPIGKKDVLMGSDTLPSQGDKEVVTGSNFSISAVPESQEEADNIFAALSEGGHVIAPMSKSFWGAYFGMLVDKFGIRWMINYDYPQEG